MASAAPRLKQSSLHSFLQPKPIPSQETITTPPVVASSTPPNYELLLQENIRRNHEYLQKLVISTTLQPNNPILLSATLNARLLFPRIPSLSAAPPESASTDDDHEPETPFVDSSLFRYVCDASLRNEDSVVHSYCTKVSSSASSSSSSSSSSSASASIVGFGIVGKSFPDPSLAKIYSIDVCFIKEERFLVAAGGHGGFISIYGGSIEEEDESGGQRVTEGPLMS